MTDEIENQEEIVVDKQVVDEVVDEAPKELSDVEQKAEKMGWTPKDKFKGDPAKWRPADEFVERGENMLPIVKARVAQQAKEIEELKASMKQFGEYHNKTEQRAYDKALLDLKQQRADAIASSDGVTFDRVDEAIEVLKKEIDAKNNSVQKESNTEADPVYQEWLGRNKWAADPKMNDWAFSHGKHLIEVGEAEYGIDVYEKVAKAAKARFPEKFENARRASAPTVEGGVPLQRKGGKSYADLPSDAKAACDRMAKNAYSDKPKELAAFKAEYTKNYFEGA
jgi:hypothetical protein